MTQRTFWGYRRPDGAIGIRNHVAIVAVIFLGERLSAANWLGVVLVAAGTILIAYR